MITLTRLRAAVLDSWHRHQRRQQLRRELADFRTPSERAELAALLARYDTSVEELLRNVGRPDPALPSPPAPEPIPELALGILQIPRQRSGERRA
ncbi:MAG TPA: hypothetical protein VMT69_06960 [Kineosporiaceae bacterium]|nr:hypothetical protein [Kineosporiaceae bacterium]